MRRSPVRFRSSAPATHPEQSEEGRKLNKDKVCGLFYVQSYVLSLGGAGDAPLAMKIPAGWFSLHILVGVTMGDLPSRTPAYNPEPAHPKNALISTNT